MTEFSDASPTSRRRRLSANSTPSGASKRHKIAPAKGPAMAPVMASGPMVSAMQPQLGAKTLVIKNLRKPTAGPSKAEQHYAKAHTELKKALGEILGGARPAVPYEKLFLYVEDLCRAGQASQIYDVLKSLVEQHLSKVVAPRIVQKSGSLNQGTLAAVAEEWEKFNGQLKLIRSTFIYLDRTYLLGQIHTSINEMMIKEFKRAMFPAKSSSGPASHGISGRVSAGICELIEKHRRHGTAEDTPAIKNAMSMLRVLGVYSKVFEIPFLAESKQYFEEFIHSWNASPLNSYITASEKLLRNEETRRMEFNIETTTQTQLMNIAYETLVKNNTERLFEEEALAGLLREQNVPSMKALYDLLRNAGIEDRLKAPWSHYVELAVQGIIKDKANEDKMVVNLLALRRSVDRMVRDAFDKDDDLRKAMRDAFGKAMNDSKTASVYSIGTSKVGEMLAKHMDKILREGIKNLPEVLFSDQQDRAQAEREGQSTTADEDAEFDRQLDQALELSRFVEGKDTFQAFYKRDLARRLLLNRSASEDAERNMLAKLKQELGHDSTSDLEQMFKDQQLAKEDMERWKQSREEQPKIDLNVMVLKQTAWPSYPDVELTLDEDVLKEMNRFETFWAGSKGSDSKQQNVGKHLVWKHSLSHCQLLAKFPKGTKDLLVSGFQAAVLLLFNGLKDDGVLTYDEIAVGTGLQGADLDRTLQSLACAKFRVITKHPKSRDVKPTDTFTYNKAFRDEKRRIKINQVQMKETKEENQATHEKIAQDRKFETQAVIVRLMKSRKKMGHSELVAETINMMKSRGPVDPGDIKKQIDILIEKDYMERDVETNGYEYLA